MQSSALRIEEYPGSPTPYISDGLPALEVRAIYKGVQIGTRLLPEDAPKRRLRSANGLDRGANYTIGESPTVDAPAPSDVLGAPAMPLVSRWGGGFLVNVTPRMTGDIATGGKVYRLSDYLAGRGSNFTLPADGRARINCGAMSFQLAHTTRSAPLPRRWFAWRWDEQKFTVGSFLALGLFLLVSFAIPPEGVSVSSNYTGMTRAFVPFTVTAQEVPEVPEFLTKQPDKGQGEAGKAHIGQSGKLGNPNSKNASGAYAIKKTGEPPHLGKAEAEAQIRNAGLLGVLNQAAGSRFTSIFGYGSAAGDAKEDVMGNLLAANIGDAFGTGGWGITGTGNGGGGTGLGTIGIGRYNTLGGGYGHGPGIGGLGTKKYVKVRDVIPGVVTAKGSLDKEIIRRVVRLHMNEVKYCYDQQLVRKVGLEGRISVQFIIAGTGQVINSFVQSTTMNNVGVESCVVGAVKRWTFPKPTGGGIAIVSYPFNFVSGGGN